MAVWLPRLLSARPAPPWADDYLAFEDEVKGWASEVHTNSNIHGATTSQAPDIDVDSSSESDEASSESEEEESKSSDSDSSVAEEPDPDGKRKRRSRTANFDKRARNMIIECVRGSMRALDHRSGVGRNVRESVLAACVDMNVTSANLVSATARVLGVSTRLVRRGGGLNTLLHDGRLTCGHVKFTRTNGRAITEDEKARVSDIYLQPVNSRTSPSKTDQVLVRDPHTNKKDKKVPRQWLEVSYRELYQRWKLKVRGGLETTNV
jgi:hypothetical protein